MPTAEFRPDDLAAFKRRIERLEKQVADQQRRAPLGSSSISDDDGNIIVRFNGDGLQFIDPVSGAQVAEFAGENLTFRDPAGNAITTLDDDGLTITNAAGVPQLKAGNLDGAGDYGVEIGGGRARAMDMAVDYSFVIDYTSITTTAQAAVTHTVTPPSWATSTHVFATMAYQLRNSTAGVQAQYFRVDIDGVLGTGLWASDVEPSRIQNVTDVFVHTVTGSAPFDVEAQVAVNAGTNSDNVVRLYTMSTFLR